MDIGKVWEEYKIPMLLGGVSLALLLLALILIVRSVQTTTPIVFSEESTVAGILSGSIHIDIEGAVVYPGLYELPSGSRVEDAIVISGGLSGEADSEKIAATINRAAKLIDGGKLYIPKIGEESESLITSYNNETGISEGGLVNINSASQAQLEELSGVGPVTAKKIMDARPFQTLEELVSKKAVGQSLFEKIRDQLAL